MFSPYRKTTPGAAPLRNAVHQEIGGLLVMAFKLQKFVIRSREGYDGPVLTVKGYEPTRVSK